MAQSLKSKHIHQTNSFNDSNNFKLDLTAMKEKKKIKMIDSMPLTHANFSKKGGKAAHKERVSALKKEITNLNDKEILAIFNDDKK